MIRTTTNGDQITATEDSGETLSVTYDRTLGVDSNGVLANHRQAAESLAERLRLAGHWQGHHNPDSHVGGFVFFANQPSTGLAPIEFTVA